MLNGEISHNQVQRSLAGEAQTLADSWRVAKPHMHQIESEDGVAIVDDSIAEKPYTDKNDIISWHHGHSQQRTVMGSTLSLTNITVRASCCPVEFAPLLIKQIFTNEDSSTGGIQYPVTSDATLVRREDTLIVIRFI